MQAALEEIIQFAAEQGEKARGGSQGPPGGGAPSP